MHNCEEVFFDTDIETNVHTYTHACAQFCFLILIFQPIFHQELTPHPINPITQARQGKLWLFSTTLHSEDWPVAIHRFLSSDVSLNYFRNIQVNPITCIKMHVDVVVLNKRRMPVCCTLTFIPMRSSEEVKGNIQGHKLSNWMREAWKVVASNRKCCIKYVTVAFFHSKTVWKIYNRNIPTQERKTIRYFWDASFSLKCSGMRVIHVAPLSLYVRQEICIPSATCRWYCFYLQREMLLAAATNKSWMSEMSYILC